MADSLPARTTRQNTASGITLLLGLFAGLCAIFVAGATLIDWYEENTQARWPMVPAQVERAEVVASRSAPGEVTRWSLSTSLRFDVEGETRVMTLTSNKVSSQALAESLEDWAERHGKGSHVEVRYDPSRKDRAVLASPELSAILGRIHGGLVLLAGFAIACAGLLGLAKILRWREARAAPCVEGGQRGGLAFGLVIAAMGLTTAGLSIRAAICADPFTPEKLMGVPFGLVFAFAGILVGLPPRFVKWRHLLAKLLVTCFALVFDWVAFGPGEHQFSSTGAPGFAPGELWGRAAFGVFAVILDACAIAMWCGWGVILPSRVPDDLNP